MRLAGLKNTVLGIAATLMYPIVIIVGAFLICLLISQLK